MTPNGQRQLAALQADEPSATRLAPAAVTPWTPEQVGQALVGAWTRKFGAAPTAANIAILLAQWALETGWGRSCWGSNLGNARPPWPRGDVLCLQIPGGHVSEVIEGKEYFFAPPSVGSTFRAFESLDEGADWYLNSLYTRFAHAWPAVLAGDPAAYAHLLKESHYYTADEAMYTRTMVSLFGHFRSVVIMGSSAGGPPEVPAELATAVQMAHADAWLSTLDADLDGHGAANIPAELDS